jgi:hypothetical protein
MKTLLLTLIWFVTLSASIPALAIDPGIAEGSLQAGGATFKLAHAYAYRDPKELRIVLGDRQMPKTVPPDIGFLSVAQVAREGKVRGLLIQMNPDDRKQTVVTVLHPTVVSRTAGVVHNFVIANNRVSGELESSTRDVVYRTKFSAPLFTGKP